MKYRSDIDGLRAIAIIPVILFHMGLQSIPGGFIGVDIFFVISGYLISSAILSDFQNKSFDLLDFYYRRVKRIIPALLFMLLIISLTSIIVIYPLDLKKYGSSLASAALSISNFYFWNSTDYFDVPAQSKLLLHTWSLSVEEQYYIIYPLILFVSMYIRLKFDFTLWIAFFVSFILSTIYAYSDPSLAFYLPHTRVWEFLIAVIIQRLDLNIFRQSKFCEFASIFGLFLIIGSFIFINEKQPFPGVLALPVCLGTSLIIIAGQNGPVLVSRLISLRPFLWVGAISYSLYLWHWPVIVLFKELKPTQYLNFKDKLILLFIITTISIISWKFIEQHFRKTCHTRKVVFCTAALSSSVILILGIIINLESGFPRRFSIVEQQLVAFQEDYSPARNDSCFLQGKQNLSDFDQSKCLSEISDKNNILLLGDSHANHLWKGLSEDTKINFMELTVSGCRPILSNRFSSRSLCSDAMRFTFDEFLLRTRPNAVIIAGRWQKSELDSLKLTLKWFITNKLNVILVGPIVEYDAPLPKLLALANRYNDLLLPSKHKIADRDAVDKEASKIAASFGILYLSPYRTLCRINEECQLFTKNGDPIQQDYGHLTKGGSIYLVNEMLAGKSIIDR